MRPTTPTPPAPCCINIRTHVTGTKKSAEASGYSHEACCRKYALQRHITAARAVPGWRYPLPACAGDQQAALFGQACFAPGETQEHLRHRLLSADEHRARILSSSQNGLVTTMAAGAGRHGPTMPWRAAFSSAGRWSSGCGMSCVSSTRRPTANTLPPRLPDNGGVYVVPAFTGLGAPYWDMYARGSHYGADPRLPAASTSSGPRWNPSPTKVR